MAIQYDKCPSCGAKIVKGAMRCTSCGANLISAEEQEERIKRYKASQKKPSPLGAIIKFVLFLIVAGVVWYFFSEEIMTFVRGLLDRFGK